MSTTKPPHPATGTSYPHSARTRRPATGAPARSAPPESGAAHDSANGAVGSVEPILEEAPAAEGVPCRVGSRTGARLAKATATQGYGATVVLHGATYDDAYAYARELQAREGAVYIAAFDDPDIIAGQGTLGLEILADLPDVEAIVVGIGGGGLISGIATAIKGLKPDVRIIGVQASGAASLRAALDPQPLVTLPAIHTIADGIATRPAGEPTFALLRELVDQVVIV